MKNLLKIRVIINLLDITMFQDMVNDYCGEINFQFNTTSLDLFFDNENVILFIDEGKKVFIVFSVFIGGFVIAILFYALFIHREYDLVFEHDDEQDDVNYNTKYIEEYKNLELNEISDNYKGDYLEEETPRGIVFLNYDTELKLFNYYSNVKEIPFLYLETISRKFVIKYNCKKIHIDYQEEYRNAEEKYYKLKQQKQLEKEQQEKLEKEREIEREKEKKTDVFATFKSYNKDTGSIKKNFNTELPKECIVPEKCNTYKYKGKLWEYNEMIREKEKTYIDTSVQGGESDTIKKGLSYKEFIKNKNN